MVVGDLRSWFTTILDNKLNCSKQTTSYIINVFSTYSRSEVSLTKESIVLAFIHAKQSYSFVEFQSLGDWVLWSKTFRNEGILSYNDVYESLGRISYQTCYKLLAKKWPLYEELADLLPEITNNVRVIINDQMIVNI